LPAVVTKRREQKELHVAFKCLCHEVTLITSTNYFNGKSNDIAAPNFKRARNHLAYARGTRKQNHVRW
jgi:hypothetical protein